MNEAIEAICVDLGELGDEPSRKNFLAAAPELLNVQVVKDLSEAVRVAVRVNIRKALTLADAALAIAQELDRSEALAFASRAKANALWFMGECRAAVELFDTAATLFQELGDESELGRTLSSSLQSLSLLGEYDRAFAAADRARQMFARSGETWRIARLEINVANIYHRQNRYAEALAAYERAYRELLPQRDLESIGVALHNMAVCLIALDDFTGAAETYGRVRAFCAENDMPLLVAQADYNVAFLYYLRGDYTKALELLRSTRETYRENHDTYHTGLCDLDQSEIYLELGLVDEAAAMAQTSLDHFDQVGMGFESARSLINLAIAVNTQGDSVRAAELFGRAKTILHSENNQVWPHLVDLYRATIFLGSNQVREALDLCTTAAEFFRSVHIPGKHILSLLLLIRACIRNGDVSLAALHCQEALETLRQVDSPMLLYQVHFLQGRIQEVTGNTEQAYNSYQTARSALESLRSSLQRDELKIGFLKNRLEVYGRLIQLCLDRESSDASLEEALSYVEAAKSRTLRDFVLAESQPSRGPRETTQLDAHIQELRKELNWYYHRIEREQLSQDAVVFENLEALRLRAKRCEQEVLRLLLEAPSSASAGAAIRESSTATLTQIRTALGTEAALLEYFTIEERLFVMVITAERMKIVALNPSSPVGQRLRMLQFQLSKFRLNGEYVTRFEASLLKTTQSHLEAFYQELIAPVEEMLDVAHLVIVPVGPLHSLPFHALFDGREYLIDRFSVSYAPSASIFTYAHRQMEDRDGPALIMGLDDPGIPFIKEEVESVAAVVPNPILLFGQDANEEALREHGYRSRLIHIASHGQFRQDNPMFSSIRLADSFLTLYDLHRMNLPAELLTLSGCVTGLNVVVDGDEMLGLTRGLLYAGARSLLLSLWDVNDRSAAELMKCFYEGLPRLPHKADALRRAMLTIRERHPHPYHWAPFKLIGRTLK